MKLLFCFALLFVGVTAQLTVETLEEQDPFLGEIEDLDGGIDGGTVTMTTDDDDDGDDDDDDDTPTTPSKPKHQCREKFAECKKTVSVFDCSGRLKCFEEKSQCYQTYKANNPNLPTKSPEKMACKHRFDSCLNKVSFLSRFPCEKLACYRMKQMCYMKTKRGGMGLAHRGSHHVRRRHHKRKPCPCRMKCKRQWKQCVQKSKSCKDKLSCYWKGLKCMKKCKSYSPTAIKPTYQIYKRKWRPRRRWNPEIMAKCKKDFHQCVNGSSTCREEIGCFHGMKKCIMDAHRPTPCPKMMKCKTEYMNCTQNATSTCEQIECMKAKHECFENIRPTKPPKGDDDDDDNDDDDDDDDDVKMGYRPRQRWGGKWSQKRKCMKMIYEQCLNADKNCAEKMSCYMKMKKNKCMSGTKHAVHQAVKEISRKVKKRLQEFRDKIINKAKPWLYRNGAEKTKKVKNWFKKKTDGMKKRFKSWKNPFGGKFRKPSFG